MNISISIIIIAITAVISFTAFSNERLKAQLIFDPPAVSERNQWYRFFSCALIHADIMHLAFNMLSLYFFSDIVEQGLAEIFGSAGTLVYLGIYVISQFFCLLPTYLEHRHNHYYRSLGASGAVSAIIFAGIMLYPTIRIGLFILPPVIPGFIFGPLYLLLSYYLAKRSADNINHSAHIWGAISGVLLLVIACYTLSNVNILESFATQVTGYFR